jgi:hypothetical protein
MMMFNRQQMDYQQEDENGADDRLSQLFSAYREAMPDPEPSVNFTPAMWAKIEQREKSDNWMGQFAKALVTAAVAAYLITAMVSPSPSSKKKAYYNVAYRNGNYVDAMVADHFSTLDPLHLDRMSHLESRR